MGCSEICLLSEYMYYKLGAHIYSAFISDYKLCITRIESMNSNREKETEINLGVIMSNITFKEATRCMLSIAPDSSMNSPYLVHNSAADNYVT
jgi:hypothetical protein